MTLFLDQAPLAIPPFLNFALITHLPHQLGWNLTLGCAREFTHVVKVLVLLASACLHITSLASFKFGYPQLGLLNRFSTKHKCGVFFLDYFRSAFLHMSHLLTCNLLNMVFEHFQDSFDLEDSINSFIQFHQLSSHVAISYIP
jgi:hypothetical protein